MCFSRREKSILPDRTFSRPSACCSRPGTKEILDLRCSHAPTFCARKTSLIRRKKLPNKTSRYAGSWETRLTYPKARCCSRKSHWSKEELQQRSHWQGLPPWLLSSAR